MFVSGCKENQYYSKQTSSDYMFKCVDEVEYIVNRNGYGDILTPHFKKDGSLFSCEEINNEFEKYKKLKAKYEK